MSLYTTSPHTGVIKNNFWKKLFIQEICSAASNLTLYDFSTGVRRILQKLFKLPFFFY